MREWYEATFSEPQRAAIRRFTKVIIYAALIAGGPYIGGLTTFEQATVVFRSAAGIAVLQAAEKYFTERAAASE